MPELIPASAYLQSHGSEMGKEDDAPSEILGVCLELFATLSSLAAKRELLEAEQLLVAPDGDVDALLDAVWTLQDDCGHLASLLRTAEPSTTVEAAARHDALLAHAVLSNPDDFGLRTCSDFSSGNGATALSATLPHGVFPLRPWLTLLQDRHAPF